MNGARTQIGGCRGLGLVLILSLAWTTRAHAHDPPEVHQLLWRAESTEMVMLTNRGLILGDPARSETLGLMCNEAVGYGSTERPDLVLLDDGTMLIATSGGLKRSPDGGCSWEPVAPHGAVSTPAMAQHPHRHSTLYVGIFDKGRSGIEVTSDGGATFTSLVKVADNDFIQEILVAPSNPSILYASGELFDRSGKFIHYVARSSDAGATWTRTELAVLASESDVALLAVHPSAPQRLIAKTIARDPARTLERLLISEDEGRTFSPRFEAESIHAATFAGEDGDTIWVGTRRSLVRSTDGGVRFETREGPQVLVSCVAEREGVLWACGYFGDGADGLASSIDGGEAFVPRLDFASVAAPIQCDATSRTASVCAPLWADWQREILGTPPMDMGAVVAGRGEAPANGDKASGTAGVGSHTSVEPLPGEPAAGAGGGCALGSPSNQSSSLLASSSCAWLALLLRRRRSARPLSGGSPGP